MKTRSTLDRRFGADLYARFQLDGPVAQLGERRVRNAEVRSSILLGSTRLTAYLSNCRRKGVPNRLGQTRGLIRDELMRPVLHKPAEQDEVGVAIV
jgi:hypothetical protein